jgi:bifunctional non-homologous end joining protein LigD
MKTSNRLLETYQRKRDFKQTPEPRGKIAPRGGRRYVIQKHAARRLHYDFRLELDGVLKSWAVTKGPSINPADKRLAVRTEDHPVDYAGFEGVIPSGYGAGTVMLWDCGEWQPVEDPAEGMERGVLKFNLQGQRLRGGYALVRMKNRPGEKRENWLLIKERDEYADNTTQVLDKWATSVISDRDMDSISVRGQDYKKGRHYPLIAEVKSKQAKAGKQSSTGRKQSGKHRMPTFVPPQLCTLRDAPPEGDEWLHEVKYDGYRIQALLAGGEVKLVTRSGKNWTERYPAITDRLRSVDVDDAIIDGELVALDDEGHSKFSLLQNAAENPSTHLVYFAFDLLQLNGESLRGKPLTQRKQLLEPLCGDSRDELRFSSHIEGDGERVMKKACALHLEGIVSKKGSARYQSGRGRSWIKSKCIGNDEFVIAGYRKSDKPGRKFSSLLLGEYIGDQLHYRGRVGTGFDDKTMALLEQRMRPLQIAQTAFVDAPAEARHRAVWLQPELVGQVNYTERTDEGRLRHPSFLGLREDKPATQVKTEQPIDGDQEASSVAGVRLTHPDKVMYPPQGATKRMVAEYYARYADRILAYLAGRPLSLVRCPQGHSAECFYQRHHTAAMPDHIKRIDISEKKGGNKPYLLIDSAKGLVEAAQIGVLELHLWGVRADRVEYPERMIFDLDPAPGIAFDVVRDAAMEMRDVLASIGLQSFALLTGGKGIHVIVPLARRRTWDDVKAFSRALALQIAKAAPERYIATASKKKRTGRIFIDWLRNERGGTAVAPYSLRAREGAPVATPVSWRELGKIDSAAAYTLDNIHSRLFRMKTDPWRGYHELRQSLTNAQLEAVR